MTGRANDPIHPRLRRSADEFGRVLGISDPGELDNALLEIQTLLYRCGYHLELARADRVWNRKQKVRRRLARRGGARIPVGRAGRRRGAVNFAQAQLGLGLATIFAEYTHRLPKRRWDPINGLEAGPHRRLIELVAYLLPSSVWTKRSGRIPEVDYLLRISSKQYELAQESGDEAQRRGLLDPDTWQR